MKNLSDSGNSIVEFVLFFAAGLLLVLGLTSNFELELRSRTAALSIANEALRSWQISGDPVQAEAAALEAAKVFSLERKNWLAGFEGDCSVSNSGSGLARVAVKVRGVIEIAQGPC